MEKVSSYRPQVLDMPTELWAKISKYLPPTFTELDKVALLSLGEKKDLQGLKNQVVDELRLDGLKRTELLSLALKTNHARAAVGLFRTCQVDTIRCDNFEKRAYLEYEMRYKRIRLMSCFLQEVHNHPDSARQLIRSICKEIPEILEEYSWSKAMLEAAYYGDETQVNLISELQGTGVTDHDRQKALDCLLLYACQHFNSGVIQQCLEGNANPNAVDFKTQSSALQLLAQKQTCSLRGQADKKLAISMLLKAGAKPSGGLQSDSALIMLARTDLSLVSELLPEFVAAGHDLQVDGKELVEVVFAGRHRKLLRTLHESGVALEDSFLIRICRDWILNEADFAGLKYLIDAGLEPNVVDPETELSALQLLCKERVYDGKAYKQQAISRMLKAGADPKRGAGESALMMLAKRHPGLASKLLPEFVAAGHDLQVDGKELVEAAFAGRHRKLLRTLLESGVALEDSFLIRICRDRILDEADFAGLKYLIDAGLEPNVVDPETGLSALQLLCKERVYDGKAYKQQAISRMLKAGADPKRGAGESALMMLARSNPNLAAELLPEFVTAGYDLQVDGKELAEIAVGGRCVKLLRMLHESGVALEDSFLLRTCRECFSDEVDFAVMKYLIDAGLEPNAVDPESGLSALQLLCRRSVCEKAYKQQAISRMLKAGADPKRGAGESALMMLAKKHPGLASKLLPEFVVAGHDLQIDGKELVEVAFAGRRGKLLRTLHESGVVLGDNLLLRIGLDSHLNERDVTVLKALIDVGLDPHVVDPESGLSALQLLCRRSVCEKAYKQQAISMLLQARADPKRGAGESALMMLARTDLGLVSELLPEFIAAGHDLQVDRAELSKLAQEARDEKLIKLLTK